MEQIGLKAVLEDKDFQTGIKQYMSSLDKAESETAKTAAAMGKAAIPSGKLSGAISGLKDSFSGLAGSVPVLGSSLSILANPIGAVSAGLAAGIAFTRQSINETVEYNKTVREMTQVLGLSAEETSRVIQVADDWGISIGEVRSALSLMNKNGISPSIDNLAALADEYVNTKDKTAFAEKATKLFGRSYQTLIPILAEGGDALREQADAVSDSLIVTDEAIAKSREYEVAMDNLGDVVQGVKYELGNKFIPVLVDVANSLATAITEQIKWNDTWAEYTRLLDAGIISQEQEILVQQELKREGADYNSILLALNTAIEESTWVTDAATASTDLHRIATEGLVQATEDAEVAIPGLAGAISDLAGKFDEANKMAGLLNEGLNTISKSMVDQERIALVLEIATGNLTAAQIEERLNALDRLEAMQQLNDALKAGTIDHYDWIAAMADGQVTQEEVNALLGIADDTLGGIQSKVSGLDGMTANVDIIIDVKGDPIPNIASATVTSKGEPVPFKEKGGAVMRDKFYIVGEKGPELFIPDSSGTIVPTDITASLASSFSTFKAPVDYSKLSSFWEIGEAIRNRPTIMSDYTITAPKSSSPIITIGPVTITNDMDMTEFTAAVETAVLRAMA